MIQYQTSCRMKSTTGPIKGILPYDAIRVGTIVHGGHHEKSFLTPFPRTVGKNHLPDRCFVGFLRPSHFLGGVDHFRLWVNNSYVSYILLKLSYLSRWCSLNFRKPALKLPIWVHFLSLKRIREMLYPPPRIDRETWQVWPWQVTGKIRFYTLHFPFNQSWLGGQIPSLTGKNHIFLYSNHTKDRNII